MSLRLLSLLSLSFCLLFTVGCDDDDDTSTPEAGTEVAGEAAGTEVAGEEAGTEVAGDEAGTEVAGDEAGTETMSMNIVETAAAAETFTTLLAAAEAAGLAELLTTDGPFTVLAPSDDVFAALPEGTVESLLADAADGGTMLADILKLHVVAGAAVASSDLTDGQVVTTENGDLTVTIADGTVTFSNGSSSANVTTADIVASNGVIHVIDSVLMPPADEPEPSLNIVETAAAAETFTTLLAAAEAAGLAELLTTDGPFTVLAPSDEVFEALPDGTVEGLLADAEAGGTQLADILKLHVVAGAAVASTDLTDGQTVTTENGELTVSIADGTVTFTIGDSSANVTTPDIFATNGVIHVIDSVLMPPAAEPEEKTIVETAVDDGRFTTLVAAVTAAGFVDTLNGDGPFTVLAPTDDAFDALDEGVLDMLLMDADMGGTMLADILNLHVVDGAAVMSADLTDGQTVITGNGELTVSIADGVVTFSNANSSANVAVADVAASNGVIHAIDAVLMP